MLNQLFTSEVRVKILTLLLLGPREGYHVRELVRRVGTEINAVRRELDRLVGIGLLKRIPMGNRLYYRVDTDHYLYPELLALMAKQVGLAKQIHDSRRRLGNIEFALLSLEFIQGRVSSDQEVDLLIIGKPDMKILENVISEAEKSYGRSINYTVLDVEEYEILMRRADKFLLRALIQPHLVLLGDEAKWCRVE